MFISTFMGAVYVVQLHFNFINVKGTVTSSLQFYASLWDSVVYVSAHDDNVEGFINLPLIMTI